MLNVNDTNWEEILQLNDKSQEDEDKVELSESEIEQKVDGVPYEETYHQVIDFVINKSSN